MQHSVWDCNSGNSLIWLCLESILDSFSSSSSGALSFLFFFLLLLLFFLIIGPSCSNNDPHDLKYKEEDTIPYLRYLSHTRLVDCKFGNFHGIYMGELCRDLRDCKRNISQRYCCAIRRLVFYKAICLH